MLFFMHSVLVFFLILSFLTNNGFTVSYVNMSDINDKKES